MVKICKYFFLKNSAIVLHCLYFGKNEWKTCVDESCLGPGGDRKYRKIDFDLDRIQRKIWVDNRLKICSSNSILASTLIPKLYNGNIQRLYLRRQNITFNDFLFLSQKVWKVHILKCNLVYQNGIQVPYEVIVANLPMARYLNFKHADGFCNFSNTVAELLKLSHFKNFKGFGFNGLNESFDIGTIFEYLKKNKTTGAFFIFTGQISEEYKEKLEAIVDEVLGAESPRSYIPPYIKYDGQEDNKKEALLNLCKPYL